MEVSIDVLATILKNKKEYTPSELRDILRQIKIEYIRHTFVESVADQEREEIKKQSLEQRIPDEGLELHALLEVKPIYGEITHFKYRNKHYVIA